MIWFTTKLSDFVWFAFLIRSSGINVSKDSRIRKTSWPGITVLQHILLPNENRTQLMAQSNGYNLKWHWSKFFLRAWKKTLLFLVKFVNFQFNWDIFHVENYFRHSVFIIQLPMMFNDRPGKKAWLSLRVTGLNRKHESRVNNCLYVERDVSQFVCKAYRSVSQ